MATAKLSQIEGGRELAAVLRQLPQELARNALGTTARAGAKELQRAAYAYLTMAMQKRSAREDDVIIKRSRTPRGAMQAEYVVGPPRRKPWLRWLHDGTAAHLISATTKYGTRRGARNVAYGARAGTVLANKALGLIFGRIVNHPGQPPRPWLRIAQFASRSQVLFAMGTQVRKALPRQAKRLVSSKYRSQQIRKLLR